MQKITDSDRHSSKMIAPSSNPQSVNTQETDMSFATCAISIYNRFYFQNIDTSLFERCLDYKLTEFFQEILCNFKNILIFRLISKKCYNSVNLIMGRQESFLANKVCIPCVFYSLDPKIHIQEQEKLKFACKNTQVKLTISLLDLLQAASVLDSPLYSLPQNRLKIILKIEKLEELNLIIELFSNSLATMFCDKVVELDLRKININYNNIDLIYKFLKTVFNDHSLIKNIKTLSLGDLRRISIFTLPDCITNITALSFNRVFEGATLNLHDNLSKLESLSLDFILDHAILNLGNKLDKLETFSLGRISNNIILHLPDCLPSLTAFNLKQIADGTICNLNSSNSFLNLTTLFLGDIGEDVTLTLPKLCKLRTLSFNNIDQNAVINLPDSCDGLQNLQYSQEKDQRNFADRLSLLYLKCSLALTSLFHS